MLTISTFAVIFYLRIERIGGDAFFLITLRIKEKPMMKSLIFENKIGR